MHTAIQPAVDSAADAAVQCNHGGKTTPSFGGAKPDAQGTAKEMPAFFEIWLVQVLLICCDFKRDWIGGGLVEARAQLWQRRSGTRRNCRSVDTSIGDDIKQKKGEREGGAREQQETVVLDQAAAK